MLDKKEAVELAKKYADAVTREFAPAEIILFGSYIYGEPHDDSDIDVAVVFNGFDEHWYETRIRLWNLTSGVSHKIEPVMLDNKDDNVGFYGYVRKHGEIIYQS